MRHLDLLRRFPLKTVGGRDLGSEVAGQADSPQPTQPNPNPIYRTGRPVVTEQTSRSSAQEIDTRCWINGDWMLSQSRTTSSERSDLVVLGTAKLRHRKSISWPTMRGGDVSSFSTRPKCTDETPMRLPRSSHKYAPSPPRIWRRAT